VGKIEGGERLGRRVEAMDGVAPDVGQPDGDAFLHIYGVSLERALRAGDEAVAKAVAPPESPRVDRSGALRGRVRRYRCAATGDRARRQERCM
jgi:hypothetical protein